MSYHSSSSSSSSNSSSSTATSSSSTATSSSSTATSGSSSSNVSGSVYYLQGKSISGNTRGLVGYFYPLYTDTSLINGTYHSHQFAGLDEVFYMPSNEMNHGVSSPPAEVYYGNLMYQEYATYNVINTIISYTNISTEESQPVIAIASNGRDFDPFNTNIANTESLRVEELIPEQLRQSSEKFISLIKDYYDHLNTEGLPTYETNRIIDEHDIDEVSTKYLDGIQGEIAKNIPDSAVMDRVSLYKKIVQYYTLKGSEESITTFFRLFFDEIIEVSYPKERLFELSSGDWKKVNSDFTRTITASIITQDIGTEYNWTPFQLKNDSDLVLGTGNIISVEETVLFDTPPTIDSLVIDLNSKNNLDSNEEIWDSIILDKPLRGYFREGATFNPYEDLVQFNGTSSFVDFGDIGNNPEISLDTEEHTFVVRAFPRINKENTEIQPLFSLSKDYGSLHSHELFFNKTTNKIGRSFIETGEPRIALHSDGISLVFSNFIDRTSIGLSSLQGDEYDHMESFLSPLGYDYNGRWQKTLIQFNGKFVYVHEDDPVLDTFTQDDLKFYTFDGNTFNGPDNLKIGQTIYGTGDNDFSDVIAVSEDGLMIAIGSAKNDEGGNNAGSARVYTLANFKVHGVPNINQNILNIKILSGGIGDVPAISVGDILQCGGQEFTITDVAGSPYPFENIAGDIIVQVTLDRFPSLNGVDPIVANTLCLVGDSTTWSQVGNTIVGNNAGDLFGSDIAINSIGNRIAIGAPRRQPDNLTPGDENYTGEIEVWTLNNSTNVWEKTDTMQGGGFEHNNEAFLGITNSRLGSNISLNGGGRILAFGSGGNPNVDFDIGTEEEAGLLLEDFNGFGTSDVYNNYEIINVQNVPLATDAIDNVTQYDLNGIYKLNSNETGYTRIDSGPGSIALETLATGTADDPTLVDYSWGIIPPNQTDAHAGTETAQHSGQTPDSYGNFSTVLKPYVSPPFSTFDYFSLPTQSFVADGTTVTITGAGFDTTNTHILVSDVSHQYDGLFEISSITSTSITYIRSGPTLTLANFSFEIGTNPTFGEIDGGKHVGARIPERTANEVQIWYDNVTTIGSASSWNSRGSISATNDAKVGVTVKLSEDGNRLLIGTHQTNSLGLSEMVVKLFGYRPDINNTTWEQIGSDKLFPPQARLNRGSIPISLSNDGKTFAVGIIGDETQPTYKGKVEIYSLNNDNIWTKVGQTIEGENAGDNCGASVALNSAGNVIVIGSPNNDNADNDSDSGQARVFFYATASGLWRQAGSNITGTAANDNLGASVSINSTGTRVIVSSRGDDQGGENRGKIEALQVAIKATIQEFLLLEKNPTDNTSRWTIKSKDKEVYYTDWYSNPVNINPYDSYPLAVKWNKGHKQGDENLPVLPHCEHTKDNNGHLFTLHNRGYLSIYYKHNGEYTPWQDITIGDTTVYGEERLWDILDYAVDGTHLILLDRPINRASRLVIFKVDEYNRYNFYQTVSLNLPTTHVGSADFAHVKFNNSQIVVGTHTFNNIDIAQVIQIYSIGAEDLWSSDEYLTLPPTYVTPITTDLEFNINKNVTNGKWESTDNSVNFQSNTIGEGVISDNGVEFDSSTTSLGSGLGFNIATNFALSLRFKTGKLFSSADNILTIGNVTLRVVSNSETSKKQLQIVSQESGKTDYSIFLDKIDTDIILDDNPLEIFSDEYYDSEILRDEWNNLTLEFTVNADNIISGLRYSLNGFKRSKSQDNFILNNPSLSTHGITSTSQLTLHSNVAFSHVSFYNKELTHTEFESLERNLSSNYTETVTTGINSLLDGGKFDVSESGTIIIKVTDCGINIWEKISAAGWKNYYNTLTSITDTSYDYITHNGSRLYSFKFWGDDLLIVNGGVNNAKQFVDQYNYSSVYNKAQHNSRAKLYYIKSQYATSHISWKLESEFSPSIPFSQNNDSDFKVGLNYGVDIIVDNENDSFAVSLEPNSVNTILNGPNSDTLSVANSTTVKYDIYKRLSNNNIRSIPYIQPADGFPQVNSYSGRLNSSAVLKIVNRSPSYGAVLSFPNVIHTTSPEKPMVEYKYDNDGNPVGYYKTTNEYNSDFVISTAHSSAVYSNTLAVETNAFNIIMVKGKADRYAGYVAVSLDGSSFETIISGNTIRHLTISPESNIVLGRNGSGYYKGEISHSQYYTAAISDYSRDQIVTYFNNNVKKYYRLILDEIKGTAVGATKITSVPFANSNFTLGNLDGHAFNSFLQFEEPENKLYPESNTAVRIIVDYGESITSSEQVFWGDGRLDPISNNGPIFHEYTLEYLGEYFDKKGRVSGKMRLQDSVFWQKFSYEIRSGLKVDDWENTFLNLVHPAGLRFFATVILLVIRDNHWYGPKSIQFNPVTRENESLIRVEDKFLSPFRTTQPLEDMRWLESLTAPTENGGYHMPIFQPGWLQGDIRVREFIFEAGLWTQLARSVPGNNLASKYTYSYFENGSDSGDIEFRILSHVGDVFEVTDIVTQGPATYTDSDGNVIQQKRGIISTIAADGNEFTGVIKAIGGFSPITNGDIVLESDTSRTATITTVKIKRYDEVINVFGTDEQNDAYLLQDRSTIDINSEMFMRAVLTTFKYVIPSLVPQKEFTKRDYEQNLKFKDINDISSYLNTTIKDALDNVDVFMNVGALISKRNQLRTEGGDGVFLETDTDLTGADEGLLLDDIASFYNNPDSEYDLSPPIQLNITSYSLGTQIVHGDRVYQDITDDSGANIRIEGLVVDVLNDGSTPGVAVAGDTLLVGWRSAINTDTNTVLPSKPELDQLFRAGNLYTIIDPYSETQDTTQETVAQITITT